jgi:hypothetical protein
MGQVFPGGLAGTWTDNAEEATAGSGAELELSFLAQDVYLVLSGTGTLLLHASPGVEAYDFTFG